MVFTLLKHDVHCYDHNRGLTRSAFIRKGREIVSDVDVKVGFLVSRIKFGL